MAALVPDSWYDGLAGGEFDTADSSWYDGETGGELFDDATQSGDGDIDGSTTVLGVGQSIAAGTGTITGSSTVTGQGQSTWEAVGDIDGLTTVLGVGDNAAGTQDGDGDIDGLTTVLGIGESIWEAAGDIDGSTTVLGVGYGVVVVEGVGLITGGSTVLGASNGGVTTGTITSGTTVEAESEDLRGGAGLIEGSTAVVGISGASYGATAEGIYTYLPIDYTFVDFSEGENGGPRRQPMISINDVVNDTPNDVTFDTSDEVIIGQNLELDLNDGAGVRFNGVVQKVDLSFDDQRDQTKYGVTATDYTFFLDKRRPFAAFTDVSASVAVAQLVADWAPTDFTSTVEASLPNVTITFDGSTPLSQCLTQIGLLVAATWKLENKNVRFFTEDTDNPPDEVNDDNDDLIKDTPVRMTTDISQVRNRVFGKGAGSTAVADTFPGATQLEVEGLDLFSPAGGDLIIGEMRITYSSVMISYVPVDRGTPPEEGSVTAAVLRTRGDGFADIGPINAVVQYRVSHVRNTTGESAPTDVTGPLWLQHTTQAPTSISSGMGATWVTGSAGFMEAGVRQYYIGWKLDDGTIVMGHKGATYGGSGHITVGANGSVQFHNMPTDTGTHKPITQDNGFASIDLRVVAKVLYRSKIATGLVRYFKVAEIDLADADYLDTKSDAALGSEFVFSSIIGGIPIFNEWNGEAGNSAGVSVKLSGLIVPDDDTVTGHRIYRRFNPRFPANESYWTDWVEVGSINDNVTDEFVDDEPTSWASQSGTAMPGDPAPIAHFLLSGIPASGEGSITRTVRQGESVNLWLERNDLDAQSELATFEGGDGVHEYYVPDTNGMLTYAEMEKRLDAELLLFARPIVTVTYATRDEKTKAGKTVVFNLSEPPIEATLKIQSVRIDQLHEGQGEEATTLKPRRTVTASSIRFTLNDLLRRVLIK